MVFVLSGVETTNKGAELMIYAILQEIEKRYPASTVYFDANSIPQGLSYLKTTLRLKEKPIVKIRKICEIVKLPGILRKFHIFDVLDDVYAIPGSTYFFDASGFHFSDQWNWKDDIVRQKMKLWRSHHEHGTKIVFLPQAFGPFNKEYSRKHVSDMSKYADVIMARDHVSLNYLEESGIVEMSKVKLFSDFTSLVHGTFPQNYSHLIGAVCIIPNYRMIDKGAISFNNYIKLITSIIDSSRSHGAQVYLLNHEGFNDEKLSYKCKDAIDGEIEVVTGLNGLQVKGLISTARLVITSRFHGAASALSTCVPCLATSWSHKYAELFNDYKQEDCVLPLDNQEKCIEKLSEFLNESNNKKIRDSLKCILPSRQDETRKMWDYIWNL